MHFTRTHHCDIMQTSNILLAVFCTVGGVAILALIGLLVMKRKQQPSASHSSSSRKTTSSHSRSVSPTP